jgi:Zn-dependent protease/CBS domain-containing protein
MEKCAIFLIRGKGEESMTRAGLGIGRLFGIQVRIDWSWLFIFLLVTWNLSFVFSQLHQDWGFGLRWGLAIVASLLFFLSVLAHELAHSLVARARGIPVRNITLFLFGGVSNIERDPKSPKGEFLIAIVGPLTSIILGGLLVALAVFLGAPGEAALSPTGFLSQAGPLITLLMWLGSINILLGIFNMVPGFPLDGGRVLRSIFWSITGNFRKATRYASRVGQLVAWIFIVAGIAMIFGLEIPVFGTGLIGGVWLAFIGWFLNSAASQSYQQVVINDILGDVPVERLMRQDPPTVPARFTIDQLINEQVMGSDDHAFPVIENDRLIGLITLEDVRHVPREKWGDTLVEEIMTPADKLITVTGREDAAEAMRKLSRKDVNQLPVMEGVHMVGLLRRRDIVRWLQIHSDNELGV